MGLVSWRTYTALEFETFNPTSKRGTQKQGLPMTSELTHYVDDKEVPLKAPKAGLTASQLQSGWGVLETVHLLRVWGLCAVPTPKSPDLRSSQCINPEKGKGIPVDSQWIRDTKNQP